MTGVSIVIPVYNALADVQECLASIYESRTAIAFEVIVVDNGSDAEVSQWLTAQQSLRPNLLALRFEAPLGFSRAMNEGVRRARQELIVLLNSDTLVSDGWLDGLAGALQQDATLGIVSPVTNRCGHPVQADAESSRLEPHQTQEYAASIRERNELMDEPQRLVFFCVMLRRALWEQLAGLDETFRTGNFEDDDFCLRTRLAGFRMAIVRSVFVFHSEQRTFRENRLNHSETLAVNGALFAARARRWSTQLRPPFAGPHAAASVSVIVAASRERAGGLRDSLASLANQTIQGFEVIVVHPHAVDVAAEFDGLAFVDVTVADDVLAELLNAGLAAASRSMVTYLCAGDIYFPFHLELLHGQTLEAQAAYTAWSVISPDRARVRRERVEFHDAEPGLALGDWAPLLCWMHRRSAVKGSRPFDASLGNFCGWAFVLEQLAPLHARYLCRVTCERLPDAPDAADEVHAHAVMTRFPVASSWQQTQRDQFLAGVRTGVWEERLILTRQEILRRAQRMTQASTPARADSRELARLRMRLDDATARVGIVPRASLQRDVILFNIVGWASLTQRPHHFARGLAARGYRVFWVDIEFREPETVDSATLLRELAPNIFEVDLPACAASIYRLHWTGELVQTMTSAFAHIRGACGIASAVQLVNFPRWQPLASALQAAFGWPTVYDCLDDQAAFAELYGHDLGQSEVELVRDSAGVIVSGNALLETMSKVRPDCVLIENGVDYELFHEAQPAGLLDHLQRPVVGFFGAFGDWLDMDWIQAAATEFPDWTFVYVGQETFATAGARQRWKQVTVAPNVHVFPRAEPAMLTQYLAQFNVCTMPFQDLPITRSMNAVKIYEYLAAGKPVLATDLPETRPLAEAGLITIFHDRQQSFEQLRMLVSTTGDEAQVQRRTDFAAANAWSDRIVQLSACVDALK